MESEKKQAKETTESKEPKENKIDRTKLKEPAEVSGWGPDGDGHDKQDMGDIAKGSPVKPEFEQGTSSREGRGDGSARR